MQVRFRVNLGRKDAANCKHKTGESLDAIDCTQGCVVDVGDSAAEWLAARGIVEPLSEKKVRGVAKPSEIIAPAKDAPSSK